MGQMATSRIVWSFAKHLCFPKRKPKDFSILIVIQKKTGRIQRKKPEKYIQCTVNKKQIPQRKIKK